MKKMVRDFHTHPAFAISQHFPEVSWSERWNFFHLFFSLNYTGCQVLKDE